MVSATKNKHIKDAGQEVAGRAFEFNKKVNEVEKTQKSVGEKLKTIDKKIDQLQMRFKQHFQRQVEVKKELNLQQMELRKIMEDT